MDRKEIVHIEFGATCSFKACARGLGLRGLPYVQPA
jgi:hypothetical protein